MIALEQVTNHTRAYFFFVSVLCVDATNATRHASCFVECDCAAVPLSSVNIRISVAINSHYTYTLHKMIHEVMCYVCVMWCYVCVTVCIAV